MSSRHPIQYTIRNVSPETDRRLRDLARRTGTSLNKLLIKLLSRGLGLETRTTYRDLDGFFGSWVADPQVDQALRDQRTIDPGLWH